MKGFLATKEMSSGLSFSCQFCDRRFGFMCQVNVHMSRDHREELKKRSKVEPDEEIKVKLEQIPDIHEAEPSPMTPKPESVRVEQIKDDKITINARCDEEDNLNEDDYHFEGNDFALEDEDVYEEDAEDDELMEEEEEDDDAALQNETRLNRKMKNVFKDDDGMYSCDDCDRKYRSKFELRHHLVRSHGTGKPGKGGFGKKLSECYMCDKSFNNRIGLKRHLEKDHNVIEDFRCPICDEFCESSTKLDSHVIVFHPESKPFQCQVCENAFDKSENLRRHIRRTHFHRKQVVCDICGKMFVSKEKLKQHVKAVHEKEKKFACSECPNRYSTRMGLSIHVTVAHSKRGKEVACDQCGKLFTCEFYVKKHINYVHLGKKRKKPQPKPPKEDPSECKICHKLYTTRAILKKHIRLVHEGQKAYQCHECGASYGQSSELKRHMATYHSEATSTCKTCGKSFSSESVLEKHMIFHDESRRFVCPICMYRYKTKKSLESHVRSSHQGDKPYSCTFCGQGFYNKGKHDKHVEKFHSHRLDHTDMSSYNEQNSQLQSSFLQNNPPLLVPELPTQMGLRAQEATGLPGHPRLQASSQYLHSQEEFNKNFNVTNHLR